MHVLFEVATEPARAAKDTALQIPKGAPMVRRREILKRDTRQAKIKTKRKLHRWKEK